MDNTDYAMAATDLPQIPARMVNEFVYCPRLAYLEWVQAEFSHNEFTVDGAIKHKRVDKPDGDLPAESADDEKIHARSVWLTSEQLGLTAKIDLVEGDGRQVTPVDYKRGKRPHIEGGVYEPERVQLCVQGLLLREHGFSCAEGIIWFAASKERVRVGSFPGQNCPGLIEAIHNSVSMESAVTSIPPACTLSLLSEYKKIIHRFFPCAQSFGRSGPIRSTGNTVYRPSGYD